MERMQSFHILLRAPGEVEHEMAKESRDLYDIHMCIASLSHLDAIKNAFVIKGIRCLHFGVWLLSRLRIFVRLQFCIDIQGQLKEGRISS